MKYIFIDIDGTLFSPKINGIPETTKQAIKQAKKNGNKVFLCTGRSLAESKLFLNLDIDGFVFCAGTLVYVEGKRIYEKAFDLSTVNSLISLAGECELGYCLEGYAGAYSDSLGYNALQRYFSGGRNEEETEKILLENCFYHMDNYHHKDPISKMNMYGTSLEAILNLSEQLPEGLLGTVALEDVDMNNYALEVTDETINKATGIAHVLKQYPGSSFEDVIAIGDSANDIDMVKEASIGIAMGNASERLKVHADYITSDIMDDGIYNAFKHFNVI